MSTGEKWGCAFLAVFVCIFLYLWHLKNTWHDNINVKATIMRGESLCQRSNSEMLKVDVGYVYRPQLTVSKSLSTVRCVDNATGEVPVKEFKSVLYREGTE